MFAEIIPVVVPIFICAGLGFLWQRRFKDYPSDFVGRLVTAIGAPSLIFHSLTSQELPFYALGQVALVALVVFVVLLFAGYAILRMYNISVTTYLPPFLFSNVGNMGLPVCLFAFGEQGLTLALGYFIFMMLAQLTIGLLILQRSTSLLEITRHIFTHPMILGMIAGLVTALVPGLSPPKWLSNTTYLLGSFTIPLMLLTLGVSLSDLSVKQWRTPLVLGVIRAVMSLGLTYLVCELLNLDGAVRGVALLMASMPAAVFNYLFAIRYQRQPETVAGFVIVTTLLSLVVLPFTLLFLL